MLTIDEALEIIASLTTEEPAGLEQLRSARDVIARELHAARDAGTFDLEALTALREAYDAAVVAIGEAEARLSEAASAVDELLADVENPDADADDADDAEEAAEAEPVSASSGPRVLSVREAVARLGLGGGSAPAAERGDSGLERTRSTVFIAGEERGNASYHDLAHAFANHGRSKGKERIGQIITEFASERTLPGETGANTRLLDSLLSPSAVAAAGGCCSLPTPIYDNPVLSSTARPIRDSLPTIGASRGGVTYFPAICIPEMGAQVWTCEDDAAVDPDDPETWKQCLTAECDDANTTQVVGIPSCVEIGTFQARYAPEQWEGILRSVAALQARVAEANLFAAMRAGTTSTHTGTAYGSTYVNLLNNVAHAAALIRQDQRLLDDVTLVLTLPAWVRTAIRNDLRIRRVNEGDSTEATDALIAAALANENIRPVWSPDIDDIEGFQYDGPMTAFPEEANAVLAPEGYFTFLDGGELNFGTEIRGMDEMRQNKVGAFAESFEGLLPRGCNAKELTLPIESCETAFCAGDSE